MILIKHENPYKLPATFHVDIAFPHEVKHQGEIYLRTGAYGVNKDGIPYAEYKVLQMDMRLWMDANLNITPVHNPSVDD